MKKFNLAKIKFCFFCLCLFSALTATAQSLPYFSSTPSQLTLSPLSPRTFTYYTLTVPAAPTQAFILIHGHSRDIKKTLQAEQLLAEQNPGKNRLYVAPFFAVDADHSPHCQDINTPKATDDNATWTCQAWMSGDLDSTHQISSFQAIDLLVAHLLKEWPSLTKITIAGFSAGAQFTQHYIGFAHLPPHIKVSYIVADPGSWLYFTPDRMNSSVNASACADFNQWKYGLDNLPGHLAAQRDRALSQYQQADITYLAGSNDTGTTKKAYYRILDKSCAANAQGEYRLERAMRYADYDQQIIKPATPHTLHVIPQCGHQIACIFKSSVVTNILSPAY